MSLLFFRIIFCFSEKEANFFFSASFSSACSAKQFCVIQSCCFPRSVLRTDPEKWAHAVDFCSCFSRFLPTDERLWREEGVLMDGFSQWEPILLIYCSDLKVKYNLHFASRYQWIAGCKVRKLSWGLPLFLFFYPVEQLWLRKIHRWIHEKHINPEAFWSGLMFAIWNPLVKAFFTPLWPWSMSTFITVL